MQMPQFSVVVLRLPNGRIVLQRRSKDAPRGAGMLGAFGGWIESGESPVDCARRELAEETSLSPDDTEIEYVSEFTLRASKDFNRDRHYYVFEATIGDANFEVFEGDHSESYSLEELRNRKDIIPSSKHVFEEIYE